MMAEIVNLTHQIIMRDTQENIEANTATIAEASLAYATDMNQIGIYASGSWIWVASGSGGTSGTFVGARYNSSAGQIIVTGAAQAIIDFDHKVYDTNNAVTSGSAWKFTVPETAYYHIDACAYLSASGSWNVGERVLFNLFISGSTVALLDRKDDDGNSPTASEVTIHGSVTLHLTAGQYLDVRIAQNSGANIALSTDPTQVWINIEMVNGVLPTTGDVVASGSAIDGNLAIFDGDIYHIKDGGAPHNAVTIQDTDTIDLSLSGQQISANLKNTAVVSGSYTNPTITVDAQGRITAASNGSSGSSAGGAATNNPFLTSGSSPDLTNYRQLVAGTNISFDTSTPGQLSISAASGSSSGSSSGDVVGPSSATDGHLAVFSGSSGKLVKDGGAVPSGPYTQGARVYNDGNQSISDSTDTTLAFTLERYDTDSIHDNTTNNSRLTCKTAGKYLIIGNVRFASVATKRVNLRILYNNTDVIAWQSGMTLDSGGGPTTKLNVSTIWDMSVNDYVELQVEQESGGSLNVLATAKYSPEFMMQRIG